MVSRVCLDYKVAALAFQKPSVLLWKRTSSHVKASLTLYSEMCVYKFLFCSQRKTTSLQVCIEKCLHLSAGYIKQQM